MDIDEILKSIKPSSQEIEILDSSFNSIQNIVKNNQSSYKISKVLPSGSYAKNTNLRGNSEIDVVFISPEVNSTNISNCHKEILLILSKNLEVRSSIIRDHSLNIQFTHHNSIVKCDILLGKEVNSPMQCAEVNDITIYQGITSKWHVEYVKHCSKYYYHYRDVVRLLKLWRNQKNIPLKNYHFELIVGSTLKYFNKVDINKNLELSFRKVNSILDGKAAFPFEWKYFNPELYKYFENRKNKPLLIDPANYKDNVLEHLNDEEILSIKRETSKAITYFGK